MQKEEYKGYTIEVEQDLDPESPREWDCMGTMVCFHKRYDLGDKTDLKSDQFGSWNEVYEYLKTELKAICISPLYLYDHSGLRIKIGDFYGCALSQGHAEFDSGQVGFIYATRKAILKNFGLARLTQNVIRKAEKLLEAEVEVYDQYLAGNIYVYSIEDSEGDHVDALGGIYGYEYALGEAESFIDDHIKQKREERQAKLKAQIKHKAPLEKRV